ncbi:MAG: hypothetical protein EOO64_00430 [Massilia sp.]|nr:MAG: hypothetical protein EOO64_00430 [Massilia sp.]
MLPKKLSAALDRFDKVLLAVEIAPSVYDLYTAVNDEDFDKGLKSVINASAIVGSKVAGDMLTRFTFSLCVEVGLATAVAMPVAALPVTLACGVGAVIAGVYVGDYIKGLPTKLAPVENLKLTTP